MADSLNRVLLIGNLTRDPELRYTTNDTAVSEFGLALNRSYNGKEETTFVDVTVWSKLAELCCKFIGKGRQVCVEGRLQLDTWEKDGQKRSKLVVIGERVIFLGGKKDGEAVNDQTMPKNEKETEATPAAVGGEDDAF